MITVGFVALFIAILAFWQHGMEITLLKKRLSAPHIRKQKVCFWIAAMSGLAYVTLVSDTNLLTTASMPLRIPALVLIPVLGFIIYFFRSHQFEAYVRHFPRPMVVYGQTLRIAIELLIYGSYVQGVIPSHATFEGYNLSIVAGLTAPVIACMAFLSKTLSARTLIAWNVAGLGLLAIELFIFIATLLCPDVIGVEHTFAPEFSTMPYVLILAFFIPSAAFMHLISIAQTIAITRGRALRHYAQC